MSRFGMVLAKRSPSTFAADTRIEDSIVAGLCMWGVS